ncbi:MAG: hypothetical protein FJ125_14645 [Deltaproteobacteria bacterium]|nr:hypothetical protein [Deltaproteobacteria bacterium]
MLLAKLGPSLDKALAGLGLGLGNGKGKGTAIKSCEAGYGLGLGLGLGNGKGNENGKSVAAFGSATWARGDLFRLVVADAGS